MRRARADAWTMLAGEALREPSDACSYKKSILAVTHKVLRVVIRRAARPQAVRLAAAGLAAASEPARRARWHTSDRTFSQGAVTPEVYA